jgi:hypothetical protein
MHHRRGSIVEDFELAEYQELKEEQRVRIAARDSLLNYHVVAVGALCALGSSSKSIAAVALAVPWVAIIFGWTYMSHEEKITAIGEYIRSRAPKNAFLWEAAPKLSVLSKRLGRGVNLVVLLMAFTLPSAVGPLWYLLGATDLGVLPGHWLGWN